MEATIEPTVEEKIEDKVEESTIVPIKQAQLSEKDRTNIDNLEKHKQECMKQVAYHQDAFATATEFANTQIKRIADKYGLEVNKQYELTEEGMLKVIEPK